MKLTNNLFYIIPGIVFCSAEIIMKIIVNVCYALYKHSHNNPIKQLRSFYQSFEV